MTVFKFLCIKYICTFPLPFLCSPHSRHTHIRKRFEMTVELYLESIWDTILNCFNSFSKYLFNTYCVPGCGLTKVNEKGSAFHLDVFRAEERTVCSLASLWAQNVFSPVLKEEEEIYFILRLL